MIHSKFLIDQIAHSSPIGLATSTQFQKFSPNKATALVLCTFSPNFSLITWYNFLIFFLRYHN